MNENLLACAHRASSQVIKGRMRAGPNGLDDVAWQWVVEDALRAGVRWPLELRQAYEALWRGAVAKQIDHSNLVGEEILTLIDDDLATLTQIKSNANELANRNHVPFRADQVDGLTDQLKTLREEVVSGWAWFDQAMIQEALEDHARGDYQTVQDMLDEYRAKVSASRAIANELPGDHSRADSQTDRRLASARFGFR